MSYTGVSPQYQQLVDLEIIVANYSHVAASALLFYESIITFPRESEHIWGRPFGTTTVLFALNKYSAVLQKVLIMIQIFPWEGMPVHGCAIISWINEVLLVITFLVITLFFALRVYAISRCDLRPSLAVLLLNLGLPCLSLYSQATYTWTQSAVATFGGCQSQSSMSVTVYRISTTACRGAIALSDLLVLFITLFYTFKLRRLASEVQVQTPLTTLLRRDGTLYFFAILFLNSVDIVFLQLVVFGALADTVTTLSIILVSRFMLNLQEVYLPNADQASESLTSVQFRVASTLVSTLGAPLDHSVEVDPELRTDLGNNEGPDLEETQSEAV